MDLSSSSPDFQVKWIGKHFPSGVFCNRHSEFDRVVNYAWRDMVLSVCDPTLCPCSMGIGLASGAVKEVHSIRKINKWKIEINDQRIEISPPQVYDGRLDRSLVLDKARLLQIREIMMANRTIPGLQYLFRPELRNNCKGIDRAIQQRFILAHGLLMKGVFGTPVAMLQGLGIGLTPAGDDFLNGLLTGLAFRDRPSKYKLSKIRHAIYIASKANNMIVNSFRYQAYHGLYNRDWKDLLLGLGLDSVESMDVKSGTSALEDAVNRIISCGSTSGMDELSGFLTAFDMFIK